MMDLAALHREIRLLAQGAVPAVEAEDVTRSGATGDAAEPMAQLRAAVLRAGGNLDRLHPATHVDFWAEGDSQSATRP